MNADESWPIAAVRAATAMAGIPSTGARLLRIGHCAVIALDDIGLVARVSRPGVDAWRLNAEMAFARHVSGAGLPMLTPADEISDRPVETSDGAVTFWPLLHPVTDGFEWPWLAHTLSALHRLPIPDDLVSLWDPVVRVEDRLTDYSRRPDAREDYVDIVVDACSRARSVIASVGATNRIGLVHGDPLNVIVTTAGPVLIDFDLAGVGPAEWDLVSVAIGHRRFRRTAADIEHFLRAYDGAHSRSQSFEGLLYVRELLDCSFALSLVGIDPAAEPELARRLRSLLKPGDRSRWTSLPSSDASPTAPLR